MDWQSKWCAQLGSNCNAKIIFWFCFIHSWLFLQDKIEKHSSPGAKVQRADRWSVFKVRTNQIGLLKGFISSTIQFHLQNNIKAIKAAVVHIYIYLSHMLHSETTCVKRKNGSLFVELRLLPSSSSPSSLLSLLLLSLWLLAGSWGLLCCCSFCC